MNVNHSRDDRPPEAVASGHRKLCKSTRKARPQYSVNRTLHPKDHQEQAVARIVPEWRRVYQNLYET